MREDVNNLLKDFKIIQFGHKANLAKCEKYIEDDETLYYYAWTNVTFRPRFDDMKMYPAIMFISDKRVFFMEAPTENRTRSIPLSEIHSIGGKGNGMTGGHISFHTKNERIDFLVNYKATIINRIKNVLMKAVYEYQEVAADQAAAAAIEKKIVECPGCAATSIVEVGTVGKCEYCGRHLQ